MTDGISIDFGSAYPYLEDRVLSVFGRDSASKQWLAALKSMVRTSTEDSGHIQCIGMATPIPINDLYQPTALYELGNRAAPIHSEALIRDRRDGVIFAGPGWGKTTFLHWLYQQQARSSYVLPFLFTLRRAGACEALQTFIDQLESGRTVDKIKQKSRILLLVDGYDEIDRERRLQVSEQLSRYRSLSAGTFFLTCRMHYDVYDLKVPHFEIGQFTKQDASAFIRSFSAAYGNPVDATDVLTDLELHDMEAFALHPLMLALVCILKTGPNASIPRTPIGLIRRAIDTLTFRWDEAKYVKRVSELPLDGEERVRCLMRVAYDMNGLQASWMEVERSLTAHIRLSQQVGVDTRTLLREIMQWYGLVVPVGDDRYQFVHRTIHDFLAARFWVENGTFARTYPDEWDMRAVYATCLVPDGSPQMQRMLRSGKDGYRAFCECLHNKAPFDVRAISQSLIESPGLWTYSFQSHPTVRVQIEADFFTLCKDDFLEALIEVGSHRGTQLGEVFAWGALSELFRRDRVIGADQLGGRLQSELTEGPNRIVKITRRADGQPDSALDVEFSLAQVVRPKHAEALLQRPSISSRQRRQK